LSRTGILSPFPAMLAGHVISSIQAPQLAARIRPAILTAIGLPILTTIELTIFSPVFSPINLPILPAIFSPIHLSIFTPIVLAYIIGLGNDHMIPALPSSMISAITPAIHRPRAAVQRP
jgi:hypothetical protein